MPKAQAEFEVPGIERKTIKAIEEAAEELRSVRARRMKLTKEEAQLADKLKKLLEKHGLKTYLYESEDEDEDGNPIQFDVLLDDEPHVKVRKHKSPKTPKAEDVPSEGD